jgi:hypothetical protein
MEIHFGRKRYVGEGSGESDESLLKFFAMEIYFDREETSSEKECC